MDRTPTNVGYCDMCGRLFVLANKKGYQSYDDRPGTIYAQAPIETMAQMFTGLHVMSYEMAIEDLKGINASGNFST